MKFGPVSIHEAEGKILGHNVTGEDGRRALRKGKPLTRADIVVLQALGRSTVYVAELEPGDVVENEAAERLARAAMGDGLRLSGPSTGRANLYATYPGLLRLDVARLNAINYCDGMTVATLAPNAVVGDGKMVATLKILPYAVPEEEVQRAEAIATDGGPLLSLQPLPERQIGLILSGSLSSQERVVSSFNSALRQRLQALGSTISVVDFVPLDDETDETALAECIQRQRNAGMQLIILAGETAIMDRHDIAPRAVVRAGGEIICFGAPVDPGNLLMLAYLDGVPVLGAPGCARSPKENIVDLVLPRLLAGDALTRSDIVAMGPGGLLEDVPERPLPRSQLS